MITRKDLKERFHKETGAVADSHISHFNAWVEEEYLKLLNELGIVEKMTADWVQASMDEEFIDAFNTFEFNQESIVNEIYKQNNE